MEISVISDTITTIAYSTQGLGWSNFLLNRHYNVLSLSETSSDQSQPSSACSTLQLSAVATPPTKTLPKRLIRKSRRTKRKSLTGDSNDGVENGFLFFIDGGGFININDGGGYFGGSGSGRGGNGGKGWNFDGHGGANWGESSNNSFYDPAFDFVYEVLSWIALSNCLHFAFKKMVRIVGRG